MASYILYSIFGDAGGYFGCGVQATAFGDAGVVPVAEFERRFLGVRG